MTEVGLGVRGREERETELREGWQVRSRGHLPAIPPPHRGYPRRARGTPGAQLEDMHLYLSSSSLTPRPWSAYFIYPPGPPGPICQMP